MLLIVPRYDMWVSLPPLGALYAAAQLRRGGCNVSLIDANLISDHEFWRRVDAEMRSHDSIGISANISHAASGKSIAAQFRKRYPDRKIIWGGPYPSAEYSSMIPDIADAVVVGEGETQIFLLAAGKKYSEIPGLAYFEDGKVKFNGRTPFITDLDNLPMPAWDLVKGFRYNFPGRQPAFAMLTQRGCPFRCINCSTFMHGNTFRSRSIANIIEEMELLSKEHGCRELQIWDDNFTLNPERVKGICDGIIGKGLEKKMRFLLPNGIRADIYDDEMFTAMRRANFYFAAVAVESGDQQTIDRIGKGLDLSKVPGFLAKLEEKGFRIALFFMMGFPFETASSMMKTAEFAASLPGHHVHFFRVTPLPGTSLFEMVGGRENLIGRYESCMVNYEKEGSGAKISRDEISDMRRLAYRKFYMNPKRLASMLMAMCRDGGLLYDFMFLAKNSMNIIFKGRRT